VKLTGILDKVIEGKPLLQYLLWSYSRMCARDQPEVGSLSDRTPNQKKNLSKKSENKVSKLLRTFPNIWFSTNNSVQFPRYFVDQGFSREKLWLEIESTLQAAFLSSFIVTE